MHFGEGWIFSLAIDIRAVDELEGSTGVIINAQRLMRLAITRGLADRPRI